MIHVVAESYVARENRERYIELAKEAIACTRVEKGCVQYTLTEGLNREDAFVFVEKWETRDDLDNHLQSEHMKRIIPQMRALRYEQKDVLILEEVM